MSLATYYPMFCRTCGHSWESSTSAYYCPDCGDGAPVAGPLTTVLATDEPEPELVTAEREWRYECWTFNVTGVVRGETDDDAMRAAIEDAVRQVRASIGNATFDLHELGGSDQ